MYSQDTLLPREKSRVNPLIPLKLDNQFTPRPLKYISSQANTSRSQLNGYQYGSPGYPMTDRSGLQVKSPMNDYGQDFSRGFPQPSSISNFGGYQDNSVIVNTAVPSQFYHQRSSSQAYINSGQQNPLSLSRVPSYFSPMNASYSQQQYGQPHPPVKTITQLDKPVEPQEDKVLIFLERQNALLGKLALRIQQEERDSSERHRRDLEDRLRDLQNKKIIREQEESIRSLQKVKAEESIYYSERRLPEKQKETKKSSSNTLEQLGKFYLMSKLMKNDHKRSVSDSNASQPVQPVQSKPVRRKQPKEESIFQDGEDNDISLIPSLIDPKTPSAKEMTRIVTQSNSKPVSMYPSILDDLQDDNEENVNVYKSQKTIRLPPSHRRVGSTRDLTVTSRTPRRIHDRDLDIDEDLNENSFDEELMEEEDGEESIYRERRLARSKSKKKTKKPKTKTMIKKSKTIVNEEDLVDLAEERKKKEKRKHEIRIKLRSLLWCVVYPHCLSDDVRRKVDGRKEEIHKRMSGNIQSNFEAVEKFLLSIIEKPLKEMLSESKTLDLYSPKKSIAESDLNARSQLIFTYLKAIFDKLIVGTTTANLHIKLIRFLVSISEDSGVLPHNFMFDFELKRLQFTYYATLKCQTALKSKMVIGLFILLRVLLHKIIMRPWTVIPGLKPGKVKMSNLLSIGSVLYHIVLDFFRGNVPIIPNNQSFLPTHLKVKPRNVPLEAIEGSSEKDEQAALATKKIEENKNKEVEPIAGFYTKDQLKCLFIDRKKLSDQLKALVDGWLEKIYQLTHEVYTGTSREERQVIGIHHENH